MTIEEAADNVDHGVIYNAGRRGAKDEHGRIVGLTGGDMHLVRVAFISPSGYEQIQACYPQNLTLAVEAS
jgi:hypothetical protein